MEYSQLIKNMDTLRQDTRQHLDECDLLKYCMEDLNVASKDKEEETNDLRSQQQQVRVGRWVRLRSGTICLSECLSAHSPTTFLISVPILPPTSCHPGDNFSIHAQALLGS